MNEANFSIIEDKKEHAIIWAIFKEDSDICKHHKILGDISLPYFITGENLVKFEKGEDILLDDFQLIAGLLLRYNATPPMTVTHKIKPYFKDILSDLLRQFMTKFACKSIDESVDIVSADIEGEGKFNL
jgi:hypothetical protein